MRTKLTMSGADARSILQDFDHTDLRRMHLSTGHPPAVKSQNLSRADDNHHDYLRLLKDEDVFGSIL